MIKSGALRAEKLQHRKGGVSCVVWYPVSGKSEDIGICFDFRYEDIDDFISLLEMLRKSRAEKVLDRSEE